MYDKKIIQRVLRSILGVILIILGIFGLVLPVLQGFLFLGLGLVLLAPEIPPLARMIYRLERRFPKLAEVTKHLRKRYGD